MNQNQMSNIGQQQAERGDIYSMVFKTDAVGGRAKEQEAKSLLTRYGDRLRSLKKQSAWKQYDPESQSFIEIKQYLRNQVEDIYMSMTNNGYVYQEPISQKPFELHSEHDVQAQYFLKVNCVSVKEALQRTDAECTYWSM